MANLGYLIPRVFRHFLPGPIANFMLRNKLVIKPGLETDQPDQAVKRYLEKMNKHQLPIYGKRVMVFGYGGNIIIGLLLLESGAKHVILCEQEKFPEPAINPQIVNRFPNYFIQSQNANIIKPELISIYHQDISQVKEIKPFNAVDFVLTSSVYEHLENPEKTTHALHALTSNRGCHFHFIDLRDHFFKYPFEMLCYSENTWRNWFNPTSNLNRFRIPDFRNLFKTYFNTVEIQTEERDEINFKKTLKRIRGEFLTGNDDIDCVTQICIICNDPKIIV